MEDHQVVREALILEILFDASKSQIAIDCIFLPAVEFSRSVI